MPQVYLELHNIDKSFPVQGRKKNRTPLLQGICLKVHTGETLGLIGQSGVGKTTLGKIMAGLERPTSGWVAFKGKSLETLTREEYRPFRREVQMIFQDPQGSFNPVKSLGQSFGEVLKLIECPRDKKLELIHNSVEEVGLSTPVLQRLPSQLSGGMIQRLALARVLLLKPRLIVLDEPTSCLDVTVRGHILGLLKTIKKTHQLSYVLISHDPMEISYLSDRIATLEGGRIIL